MNRGERERLPDRRTHIGAVSARVAGLTVHLHTAPYPDGRLAEVFIDIGHGSPLAAPYAILARSISGGLQFGVPLGYYVDMLTFQRAEPHGIVEGHDRIRRCDSIADYVGRELGITFGGRDDLAHVEVDT